jgi:hypothetical protein
VSLFGDRSGTSVDVLRRHCHSECLNILRVHRGSSLDTCKRFFRSQKRLDRLWGLPSLLFNGTGFFPLRAKGAGREVYHSPPSITEVKDVWSYTFTPPVSFHGVNREKFIFFKCLDPYIYPQKVFPKAICKVH